MATEGETTSSSPSAGRVRVVRCPKCGKLLPELAGVQVYRCGGCHATLQAKQPISARAMSPQINDDRKRSEDVRTPSRKKEMHSVRHSGLNKEKKSRDGDVFCGRKGDSNESPASNESHVPHKEFSTRGRGHDYPSVDSRAGRRNGYRGPPRALLDNSSSFVDEMSKLKLGKSREEEHVSEGDKDGGVSMFGRVPAASSKGSRFSPYDDRSLPIDLAGRAKHKQNPEELLRKLDSIRSHLREPYGTTKRPHGQTVRLPKSQDYGPANSYEHRGRAGWFDGASSLLNQEASVPNFPFGDEFDVVMQNNHHASHGQYGSLGCDEPFRSRPLQRILHYPQHQHMQRPMHFSYVQYNPNQVIPPYRSLQQSTCSCQHCHNKHMWFPSKSPATGFRDPCLENCCGFCPADDNTIPGSGSSNLRGFHTSYPSQQLRYQQPPISRKFHGRECRPFAGGAPFLSCFNCFQLLQIPSGHFSNDKGQVKLRCGSCTEVMTLRLSGKSLVISSPNEAKDAPVEMNSVINNEVVGNMEKLVEERHGLSDSPSRNYCRSSFNNENLVSASTSNPSPNSEIVEDMSHSNISESENTDGTNSSSSPSLDNEIIGLTPHEKDMLMSSESANKSERDVRILSPPSDELVEYPTSNKVESQPTTGNISNHWEWEEVSPGNGNFKTSPPDDTSVTTDAKSRVGGYPNCDFTRDSSDTRTSRKEEQSKMSKGGDSFFTGLVKKKFLELSRSSQCSENDKVRILVNGRRIADRLVRKAEKHAGPIQPGEYWYDYRAGFWGVMDQPCMGIIPSFIEEFNYPMPKNCAAGNTEVFVNGRELHHRDLELLVSRGLPASGGRSYLIEMSGRVLDATTGEELDGLGKLAPTIEKLKHGFGMKNPRVAAA